MLDQLSRVAPAPTLGEQGVSLEDEVSKNRQNIRSDGYAMSIGEVVNLYRDREIQIRPEFQRLFRWNVEKQSRLIESLLLDIPVPPVFVAQREDGVWEVVDGLQRLSTILSFLGELRDEDSGDLFSPSSLVKTRYLAGLEDATFSGPNALPTSLRLQFKRARLDFRILLKESDDKVKFELFDRLNSGGEPTSPQEVRTALILMTDSTFFTWLDGLRRSDDVSNSLALTDRNLNEQYDMELLIRFLSFDQSSTEELRSFADIDSFLTDTALSMAGDLNLDRGQLATRTLRVFEVVAALGPDTFRKYDARRGKTVGAFSVSAYEAVTLGIAQNLDSWLAITRQQQSEALARCAQELWSDEEFKRNSGAGVRATTRAPKMGPVGRRLVKP